jgi:hypothetical protein
VFDANPLEDIRNTAKLRYVMKNGRMYESNTLNEVYPRQKPLTTQWWLVADAGATSPVSGGHPDDMEP